MNDNAAQRLLTPTTPLTVADCLAMSPLSAATVEAGASGLQRPVRWVHVVDVPDIEECLVGGELVMTSGISLGHDVGLQRRIMHSMDRMDLAGLVLAIGPYIDRVPPVIAAEADALGIPVLSLPWVVNFRDITEVVQTAIIDRQRAMLERSELIHRGLTQLVLDGAHLPDLTARLSSILGRRTAVLDPAFQLLAESGATEFRLNGSQEDHLFGVRDLVRRGAIELTAGPTILDHDVPRGILAPVIVGQRLHGLLWIDGADRPLEPIDMIAAEHGATVTALILYKEEAVQEAMRKQERELIDHVLDNGELDDRRMQELRRLFPDGPAYVVFAVESAPFAGSTAEKTIEAAARRIGLGGQARWRGDHVVLISPLAPGRLATDVARDLVSALQENGATVRVGLSDKIALPNQIGTAYREARQALHIGGAVDSGCCVLAAAQMRSLLRVRASLLATHDPAAPSAITRLACHDREHHSDLVETLSRYLQHEGNVTMAARALGIHRHTLLYRLERIETILGYELTPVTRLDLRLDLLRHRLIAKPA